VQDKFFSGVRAGGRDPRQPHVLRLDRDSAFALDVHPVQVLRPHVPVCDDAGELQHPVRQRGLAVIDVSDDAEVPNLRRRGERLVGETADGISWTGAVYRARPAVRGHVQRIDAGWPGHTWTHSQPSADV